MYSAGVKATITDSDMALTTMCEGRVESRHFKARRSSRLLADLCTASLCLIQVRRLYSWQNCAQKFWKCGVMLLLIPCTIFADFSLVLHVVFNVELRDRNQPTAAQYIVRLCANSRSYCSLRIVNVLLCFLFIYEKQNMMCENADWCK